MDFKEKAAKTDKYNFHTHTQFCDGRDTMDNMVSAAVAEGFVVLGFTPHSPIFIPSPCNMSDSDVAVYRSNLERLKAKYAGRCELYTGMEIDYLDPQHGPSSQQYKDYGLDYSIGSVHFIKNRKGEFVDVDGRFESFCRKMNESFDNDIRYVVEEFYRASREMLALGGFDILGHFDKIGQNAGYYKPGIEDEDWYQKLVNEYIDEIIASGVTVEINTKARAEHKRFFPGERYWKRLVEAGVPIVVNSDAHYPLRMNAGRNEALEMLRKLER